jgi:hypothetical protein
MFEAFTARARQAIAGAQRGSRGGPRDVEVEHLSLGLFCCEDVVSRVWADFGLTGVTRFDALPSMPVAARAPSPAR